MSKVDKILEAAKAGAQAEADRNQATLESIEAVHGIEAAMAVLASYDLNANITKLMQILGELGVPDVAMVLIDQQVSEQASVLNAILFHSILKKPVPRPENGMVVSKEAVELNKIFHSMFNNFKSQNQKTTQQVVNIIKEGQ